MTTPWRKTIRDFQQESTRTVLVIAAIVIGMVGFTAVLSTYAVLTREINKGYLASNPASATLETDAVDDALVSAVLSDQHISEAEARRALYGSIKTGPVQWHDLTLFVIKDYGNIRISKLTPDHGAWPPKTGEMLIERDAFHVAGLQIGDTATIRIGQSKEQSLRVSGRVHDVGPAQARMENTVYGYITLDTLSQLGEQPYLDELKILVAENRFDEKHVRDVTAHVKKLVEGRGHPVRGVDVPRPGKHPHADLMDGFLLAMASFGLFVLAMSGVLVVNLLLAIMAAQVRQIGVMKAIGGTRGQVACIYFAQALLLGIAATVLALPLGMLASRALCRPFGAFLNFDITSFAVPFWVYGLALAVGIVMPLLAAAWPIWEGSAISVREGLAAWGVSQNAFGVGIFDRALARIGGNLRPLLLSIRNSFRRRTRLVLTMLTLAVSGLFFMSALNIHSSMSNTLDRSFALRKYDLQIFLGDMYPSEQIERAIGKTPGVVRAESWFTSGVSIPANDAREGDDSLDTLSFPIIALPKYSKAMDLEIVEGRNLLPGDVDALVINTTLAEESRIRAGDTITLRFKRGLTSWHVVGIAREPFLPPTTYIPQAFIDQRYPAMRTTICLTLEKTDAVSMHAVKSALDNNLEQEGIRAAGSRSKADFRYGRDQHLLMIYVFLVVISGIIAAVGGLGLATTMSLNVMERRREMGVLRAIGASPSVVMGIIVAEGVAIGVMSWILAALAAWPLSRVAGNFLTFLIFKSRLDSVFQLQGLWIWLAFSVLSAGAASLLPARSAAKLTVREALAYE
jgi:putative ABC transport system permease protein